MLSDFVFNSESVTEGHPDKLCDQVSDAVLGRYLRQDPFARLEAECAVSTGIVFLSVKFASDATVDAAAAARDVIRGVGYDVLTEPFAAQHCTVMTTIQQYPALRRPWRDEVLLDEGDIDRVVAEDQATLFGYACDHGPAYLPLPIHLARRLTTALSAARRDGRLPMLSPDGKSQVGVEFRAGRPARIHSVAVLVHERRPVSSVEALREAVRAEVIERVFADEPIRPDARTRVWINPQGLRGLGGPAQHAGLTGRKTGVDTYGEFARNSSSAMSGKDPTRVDRIGAWAARHAALNVVAAGLARQCEVQLSYTVGQAAPASVTVETFGTNRVDEGEIARRVGATFDFRPAAIIRDYRLRALADLRAGQVYRLLAAFGQVGQTGLGLRWELADRVDALR